MASKNIDHLDRVEGFSDTEFKLLPRTKTGDILQFSTAFIWVSKKQEALLSNDDTARLFDYKEDLDCMMSEFLS